VKRDFTCAVARSRARDSEEEPTFECAQPAMRMYLGVEMLQSLTFWRSKTVRVRDDSTDAAAARATKRDGDTYKAA